MCSSSFAKNIINMLILLLVLVVLLLVPRIFYFTFNIMKHFELYMNYCIRDVAISNGKNICIDYLYLHYYFANGIKNELCGSISTTSRSTNNICCIDPRILFVRGRCSYWLTNMYI